jgi:CspA family cold shock protein
MEGRVKWFNEKKGYGFIETDSQGDVFVHYTNIHGKGFRSLTKGLRVEFELGPDGRARDVRPSGLVYVDAGTCYSRTGSRIYVPISCRKLVGAITRGYRTDRGHRAWVAPEAPTACATWGTLHFDILYERADGSGPCSEQEFRRACGPGEFDAAIEWLHQGKYWGRGSSFWPEPRCLKCEGRWGHRFLEAGPPAGECLQCGGPRIWAYASEH